MVRYVIEVYLRLLRYNATPVPHSGFLSLFVAWDALIAYCRDGVRTVPDVLITSWSAGMGLCAILSDTTRVASSTHNHGSPCGRLGIQLYQRI